MLIHWWVNPQFPKTIEPPLFQWFNRTLNTSITDTLPNLNRQTDKQTDKWMERWTKGQTVGHIELDWPLLWHTVSTCSVLIEPTMSCVFSRRCFVTCGRIGPHIFSSSPAILYWSVIVDRVRTQVSRQRWFSIL